MREKVTKARTLHLTESLDAAVERAAIATDRGWSEYIRHVLEIHFHGVLGQDRDDDQDALRLPKVPLR